ncbi:MAG: ORF6N domain-containing protein, partial [Salinivirgaceae bacterium]|nr:ORF6N domain-containing protein [Salinivirgaceae bacterium]
MENEVAVIQNKIVVLRNQQVMIDRDIAELYGVEIRTLNQAVKRNIERFPERFMFQLTKDEQQEIDERLRSQIVIIENQSKNENLRGRHSKYLPYAFTEQGCAMLSAILKSEAAVQASIKIMDAFVAMRHFLQSNAEIFSEMNHIKKQLRDTTVHQIEADKRIDELFSRMDRNAIDDTQGIFFQGQIFDAYAKFESFIAQAQKSIVLIDNYVDLSVLERLTKKNSGVAVTIYTTPQTRLTAQDVQQFNAQYPPLDLKFTTSMHDRFLIIDNSTLYHIGASLKDLGKRCFAFDLFDSSFIPDILAK